MTNQPQTTKDLFQQLPALTENKTLREQFKDFVSVHQVYSAAIKEVSTKLDILNDEFRVRYNHNPIHHIESRLKTVDSMIAKLKAKGLELSLDSATAHLNDIAGVRVVCCYVDDIYHLAELLLRQNDIELIAKKDYIQAPKPNGYRSLHLVVKIPIFLSDRTALTPVEIQIRTVAMDFWASLEHSLRYKLKEEIPAGIDAELLECSRSIALIDNRMQDIFRRIQKEAE